VLPYNPATPLLGIYPKECDSGYNKGIYTPMLIAAQFIIAKIWKQPRCPTTDEWIKNMWYLYIMEFYSATKENEILSFAGKWMKLGNMEANGCHSQVNELNWRPRTAGIGQGKENKNLNVVDVLIVQE
jgi:hypothetical protein